MPINWRNINAPDLSGVSEIAKTGADQITQGLTGFSERLQGISDKGRQAATDEAVRRIKGIGSLESLGDANVQAAISEQAIINQYGAGNIDLNAVAKARDAREGDLRTQLTAEQDFQKKQADLAGQSGLDKALGGLNTLLLKDGVSTDAIASYAAGIDRSSLTPAQSLQFDQAVNKAGKGELAESRATIAADRATVKHKQGIQNFNDAQLRFKQEQTARSNRINSESQITNAVIESGTLEEAVIASRNTPAYQTGNAAERNRIDARTEQLYNKMSKGSTDEQTTLASIQGKEKRAVTAIDNEYSVTKGNILKNIDRAADFDAGKEASDIVNLMVSNKEDPLPLKTASERYHQIEAALGYPPSTKEFLSIFGAAENENYFPFTTESDIIDGVTAYKKGNEGKYNEAKAAYAQLAELDEKRAQDVKLVSQDSVAYQDYLSRKGKHKLSQNFLPKDKRTAFAEKPPIKVNTSAKDQLGTNSPKDDIISKQAAQIKKLQDAEMQRQKEAKQSKAEKKAATKARDVARHKAFMDNLQARVQKSKDIVARNTKTKVDKALGK